MVRFHATSHPTDHLTNPHARTRNPDPTTHLAVQMRGKAAARTIFSFLGLRKRRGVVTYHIHFPLAERTGRGWQCDEVAPFEKPRRDRDLSFDLHHVSSRLSASFGHNSEFLLSRNWLSDDLVVFVVDLTDANYWNDWSNCTAMGEPRVRRLPEAPREDGSDPVLSKLEEQLDAFFRPSSGFPRQGAAARVCPFPATKKQI